MACVEDSTLAALIERRLGATEQAAAEAHLDTCDACRDVLTMLARVLGAESTAGSAPGTRLDWLARVQETLGLEPAEAKRLVVDEAGRIRESQGRVGTVLREKWRIDRLIGIGGMASVYEATHRNGHRVAIKLLHPAFSSNAEIRSRALREGYVANRVGHPGVVRVIDDDTEGASVFLVMDLLEGESLEKRWLRCGRRMDAKEVLSIADKVLSVLEAAHTQGIVHRDIKPENIFVTLDGGIKVLDFGIASLRDLSSRATRTGSTMGTPAFMPQEQARGRWTDVGPRTDIWALGATMYTLLTGQYVHTEALANEQLLAAMTKPAASVARLRPDLPPDVVALVDRALAFEVGDRWESAKAMQAAVGSAYALAAGASMSTAPKLEVPEPPPSTRPGTLSQLEWRGFLRTTRRMAKPTAIGAGVVAGAAALIGVGAFLATRPEVGANVMPTTSSEASFGAPSAGTRNTNPLPVTAQSAVGGALDLPPLPSASDGAALEANPSGPKNTEKSINVSISPAQTSRQAAVATSQAKASKPPGTTKTTSTKSVEATTSSEKKVAPRDDDPLMRRR